MSYNVQQRDIDILFQRDKIFYTKVQLLNKDFTVIDEVQSEIIDASISIDAESDIRRTYSSTIFLKDDSFLVGSDKKIWLDKYIRVYLGFKYLRTQEIIYYPLGVFLFNDNSFLFDEVNKILSISCLDLMCKMTGIRNGQLSGTVTQIPLDSNIRNALINTVSQLGGFKKYIIDDNVKTVPYDLKFSTGATIYEIIKELRDLYPAWETFFDIDGTFIYQQIPTCVDNDIVLNKETMKRLVKSEQINNSFSEVKNKTEVWGKSIDADRYSETSTNTGSQYNLAFTDFEFKSGIKIAFKPNVDSLLRPRIKINALTAYGIFNEDGKYIPVGRLKANTAYIFRWKNNKFYLMGQFQIYGSAMDTNPESPYYVGDNEENVILQVLSGGDYEKIYSDDLCQQRAEYENWKSTRMTDQVSLNILIVPWLEVNQKVEYTALSTGETHQYIIKKINYSITEGTMMVDMIKFYPLYPFIVNETEGDLSDE